MYLDRKISKEPGPILPDGTPIANLVSIDEREVFLRVMSDPEVYRLELDRIFARSWVPLAHESEIPKAGDFVVRNIGEDKVIVSRMRDGTISGVLNVCTHRGAELCWLDQGNAPRFVCPYHGWTFDGKGQFVGAPFLNDIYPGVDKGGMALRAARVAIKCGIVFGCMDTDGPSLEAALGDMNWYIEQIYGTDEFEVLGPPSRVTVPINWKLFGEQGTGDAYHVATTHRALAELGLLTPEGPNDKKAWSIELTQAADVERGHVFNFTETLDSLFVGEASQSRHMFAGWIMTGFLFPNTLISSLPSPSPDGLIREFSFVVPAGVNRCEVVRIYLVQKGLDEATVAMLRAGIAAPHANAPDDFEVWCAIQRASQGAVSRHSKLRYNTPIRDFPQPKDWEGRPGILHSGIHRDDFQWNFWLTWLNAMVTDTVPVGC